MFALALLLACKTTIDPKPVDEADDTDAADTDTDPAAVDTDPAPVDDTDAPPVDDTDLPTFEPAQAFLYADFGYDPDTQMAMPYTIGTDTADPSFTFIIADATWDFDFADVDQWCLIQLSTGQADRAGWARAPFAVFGFQLPVGPPVLDGCEGRVDLPMPGNLADGLAQLVWGVGVAPGIYPPLEEYLVTLGYTEADLADTTGGFLFGQVALAASEGPFPMVLVSGYEMDTTGTVQESGGNPIPLSRDEMIVGGALQRGYYSANILNTWQEIARGLAR
jgi:hypothetical protein